MTQARLPPTTRVIMAEIFRCVPVGTWRHISHAALARRLGLSEGTVSRGMALLAGALIDANGAPVNRTPFIDRRPRQGGHPGYEICPLAPPELRPKPPRVARAADPPPVRQIGLFAPTDNDPHVSIPIQAVPTPETPPPDGTMVDPPIFLDQTCSSGGMRAGLPDEQQPANASEPDSAPTTRTAIAPAPRELPPALGALGLLAHQWRALLAAAPANYQVADCVRDLAKLRGRPDVRSPFAVLKEALAAGDPIYSQAEIDIHLAQFTAPSAPEESPPAESPPRQRGRAAPPREEFDPADARASIARLGGAASPPAPPPARATPPSLESLPGPDPRLRQLWQAALGLLRERLRPADVDSWLRPLTLASIAEGRATLTAPSAMVADGARPLTRAISEVLSDLCESPVRAQVALAERSPNELHP
jgi:hypothetical protein